MNSGWLFLGYGPIAAKLIRRTNTPGSNIVVSDQLKVKPLGFEFELYKSEDFPNTKKENIKNIIISWKEITIKRQLILNELINSLDDDSLIINLSTAAVYGEGLKKNAYVSDTKPLSRYGKLKLEGETILNEVFQNKVTHLRISNLYGSSKFQDFVTKILVSIKSDSKLLVYENGNLLRDYVFFEDLLDFLNSLSQDQHYRKIVSDFPILDFATGEDLNQLELIQYTEFILNRKVGSFQWESKPLDMVSASSQEPTELTSHLNFKTTTIRNGLVRYLRH